jgi:ATPase family AAA domain-containing protein 3A/B
MQSKLDTQQMVEGVKVISEQLSNLVQQFLSRPKQIASVFGAIAAVLFAYNLFCQFILVLRTMVQSRLGRPSLVRETSFSWSFLPDFVYRALDSLGLLFSHIIGRKSERINKDQLDAIASHFKNVILEAEAKERILLLAQATRNTKRSGAPYRHVLLHGPPGTGKTMIGTNIAIIVHY